MTDKFRVIARINGGQDYLACRAEEASKANELTFVVRWYNGKWWDWHRLGSYLAHMHDAVAEKINKSPRELDLPEPPEFNGRAR